MKTKNRIASLALVLAAFAAPAASASTWQMCGGTKVKWPSNALTLRASSVGFPSGSSWANALIDVAASWSATPSKMDYAIALNEAGVALGNGESETWWTSSLGAPAICYTWWNGSCQLVEADVVFLNTEAYSTTTSRSSLWPYGGSFRPFQTTAMHELGHAQGLGHTADTYSIMGQDWDHIHANGSGATAYPGEDAVDGSLDVYGATASAFEDLAVAHWRYTGASGAYSAHDRTRMFDSGGALLPNVGGSEPRYKVKKGQQVRIEMSYENLGKSYQSAKIGYYVSTNDYISTVDTFLGWSSVSLAVDQVYTVQSPLLTIPGSLTANTDYWVGAIIDYDGALGEANESNNATFIAIRTDVDPPDLAAMGITGPAKLKKNKNVHVDLNVAKSNYAGSYTFEIRLSTNSIISEIDTLIATGTTSAAGPFGFDFVMPKVPKGKYTIGLIVKPVGGEVATANNYVAGNLVKVKK